MIYRITLRNFLLHAIDHMTYRDLTTCKYDIFSPKITCGRKDPACAKLLELYPTTEMMERYTSGGSVEHLEKEMFDMYDKMNSKWRSAMFYNEFVKSIEDHINAILICIDDDVPVLDILCRYLKKKFSIEVIDLDRLFTKGKIDPIHYDYKEIRDLGVDIRRAAEEELARNLATTPDGRMSLLRKWSRKQKLKFCRKNLRMHVQDGIPDSELDEIIIDAWVIDKDDD